MVQHLYRSMHIHTYAVVLCLCYMLWTIYSSNVTYIFEQNSRASESHDDEQYFPKEIFTISHQTIIEYYFILILLLFIRNICFIPFPIFPSDTIQLSLNFLPLFTWNSCYSQHVVVSIYHRILWLLLGWFVLRSEFPGNINFRSSALDVVRSDAMAIRYQANRWMMYLHHQRESFRLWYAGILECWWEAGGDIALSS